ncbi:MAG: GNAT family N-acetyltransferase [Faecousia sp.]
MELEILNRQSTYYPQALELYLGAFPREERRDKEKMLVKSPAFRPGVVTENGEFCGILFYWEGEDFLFLEHFAMAPYLRNKGLGAKALEKLKEQGKKIVLEIELPASDLTRRRKGFYERNGFLENPWHHVQAKYRLEDEDLPLMLLSYPEMLTEEAWQGFEEFLRENVAVRPMP